MKRHAALLIAVLLLAAMPVLAQMTGARLSGTVKDATGAIVTDAKVTVLNQATGITRTTDTGSTGLYIFRGLQPGTYDVKAERAGFQTVDAKGLKLMIGQDMGYDLVLKVGSVSEVVDVKAETPLVESQKAQVDTVVTGEQVRSFPISGRYFFEFVYMSTPGVAGNNNGGLGEGLSVNGQRGYNNQYTLDGVTETNSTLQTIRGRINMDSIQEFQVLTHQFEAQYGNASGAVINVATKGGTNAMHGTAYTNIYSSTLDAYSAIQKRMDYEKAQVSGNPLDVHKTDAYSRVFGGTIGGPIKTNKLFYFGSYEFSHEMSQNKIQAPQEFNNAAWVGPLSSVWSGRLDFTPSEKDSFNFRYNGQRSNGIWGPGGKNTKSTEYREIFQPQSFAASWMRTISSRTLSEVRAQFAETLDNANSTQDNQYDYIAFWPHATVGKIQTVPFNTPEYNGQLVYNLSMTRGRHDIKLGGSYMRVVSDGANRNWGDGEYDFRFDLPFDSVDDPFVFPYKAAYTYPWHYARRIGTDSWHVPENVFSGFAQDKWSVTDKFVLTYGLRWDYENWFSQVDPVGTLSGKRASNPRADFGPRASFAYSPFGQKTVIRGGFGRFYSRVPLNEAALVIQNTVNTATQHWVEDYWGWGCCGAIHPWWPDPQWITDEFPAHVISYPVPPTLDSFLGTAYNIDVLDNNLKYPYTDHWTLGVQQQISNKLALNVDLVRILGRNLWTMVDRNAPDPAGVLNPDGKTYSYPRPNPTYGHMTAQASIGHSWYTAMETTLKYQASNSNFTLTFTKAKSVDDVRGDPNGWGTTCSYLVNQNPDNIRCDRALSANDLPYRLTFNGYYRLWKGFKATGTVDWHAGYPWNVGVGPNADRNADGWTNENPPGYTRNDQRGDRYIWTTMRLSREFKFSERVNWEPWVDIFNITNTPTYMGYDGNIQNQPPNVPDNPTVNTFGKPLSSTGPRVWQFGCRFTF